MQGVLKAAWKMCFEVPHRWSRCIGKSKNGKWDAQETCEILEKEADQQTQIIRWDRSGEFSLHTFSDLTFKTFTCKMTWWHSGTHTHTFTRLFNGPLSRTTRVSRYQKGKTNLDFTEARDSKWQWHQLGHMQVCTSLQTDNHANTSPLSFYRPDAPSAAKPTASKHWRQYIQAHKMWKSVLSQLI